MTEERPNIFADCENVGQLFDRLWFDATRVVEANLKGEHPEHVQRAREIAIGDAHHRYQELTNG